MAAPFPSAPASLSQTLADQESISVVDFSVFSTGNNSDDSVSAEKARETKKLTATRILESFKQTGFVHLVNHGLDLKKIHGIFDMSRKFFEQALETKMLAPHPASGEHHRGYSPPGQEKVMQYSSKDDIHTRPAPIDCKESFEVGKEEDKLMPNIWLTEGILPGFKEACLDYYWACNEAKFRILRALAVALDLPESYFDTFHQDADNQLRLLHYPSIPRPQQRHRESEATPEVNRIGAHTDFCSITLLVQDEVGGLEVESPTRPGVFTPVTPVKDALLVNAGDFLAMWSNDLIRSTMHRVRAPPNYTYTEKGIIPDRYSIVYFCATDFDKTVDCIPGTYSEQNPKKYEPTSALGYIMKRLAANY